MDAPAAGAARRGRVPSSVYLVSLARLGRAAAARAAVDDFRSRRSARRDRLVDGRLRPLRARERVAVSLGVPLDARLCDLRRDRLDGAVQFDHRMMAYALEAAVLLHAFDVARTLRGGSALTTALALASAVTLQA